MKQFLWKRQLTIAVAAAAVLALGACTGRNTEPRPGDNLAAAPCNPAFCNISDDVWQHISDRHCGACAANDKSAFIATYCGSKANAVTFCQTLMGRLSCAGVEQGNGNVAYSADFADDVGKDSRNVCSNTKRGTVIYKPSTDAVVTQFPGNP